MKFTQIVTDSIPIILTLITINMPLSCIIIHYQPFLIHYFSMGNHLKLAYEPNLHRFPSSAEPLGAARIPGRASSFDPHRQNAQGWDASAAGDVQGN